MTGKILNLCLCCWTPFVKFGQEAGFDALGLLVDSLVEASFEFRLAGDLSVRQVADERDKSFFHFLDDVEQVLFCSRLIVWHVTDSVPQSS